MKEESFYPERRKRKMSRTRIKETLDEGAIKKGGLKDYLHPKTASMEEFTLKTAVGVSPAMKKKDNYIVSTLF